jgi:hypothetical protein
LFKWAGIFVLLLVPAALPAQNAESAVGGNSSLWVGTEASSFNPDYGCSSNVPFGCSDQLVGPGVFVDFNLYPKLGAEGEARWLHWNGIGGQIESTYLGGARYRVVRYRRLDGWVKLLAGGGLITSPNYPAAGSVKGSYFAYVPGGTLEVRLTHRISVRGDYEYQVWPSFAGPPTISSNGTVNENNNGLTPNGFSVGVSYRILGH